MKASLPAALSIASLLLLLPFPAFAVNDTWDGNSPNLGAGDSNVSTGLNWADDTAPVSDLVTTDLFFGGTTKLAPNFTAAFSTDSLSFINTSGAFVLGGSPITIGTTGIANADAQTQTINNNVTLGTVSSSFQAINGSLVFNGTLALGTNTLAAGGAQAMTFGGAITGTGRINKSGAGTLTLSNTTIPADVNISAGTVNVVSGGATVFNSNSTLAINGGAFDATGNVTLDNAQLTRAAAATLNIAAGKTLTIQNGADAAITGTFVNAAASTIAVTGAGSTFAASGGGRFDAGTLNVLSGGVASCPGNLAFSIAGGTSSATVDGIGSSLTGGTTTIGGLSTFGGTGGVSLSNGSTGTLGTLLEIADSSSAAAAGTLNIQSGATATVNGNIDVSSVDGGGAGTISITGTGSALTQSGAGTLTVGAATGAVDAVNLLSGATFTSGTGPTTVNATGRMNVTGGTFNANGDILLNGTGAQLTRAGTGVFAHAAGKTLTVQAGAGANLSGGFTATQTAGANVTVTGAGSTFTAGSLAVSDGSTLAIQSGGSVGSTSLSVGTGGSGTLTVDGAGSSVTGVTGSSAWGQGATAGVTFSNNASGSFGTLSIANGPGSTAVVQVFAGADVTTSGNVFLTNTNGAATGTVTVDGAGSTWTQTGAVVMNVGGASGSAATLNVQNFGAFTTGTGLMSVNATGRININGGSFNVNGDLTLNGTGAQLTLGGLTIFTQAPGKLLTIQNGADMSAIGYIRSGGNVTVSGSGSTLQTTAGGVLEIRGDSNLAIQNGADVTSGTLGIGNVSDGTMTVAGFGSSVAVGAFAGNSFWGNGASAEVTFSDRATGSFAGLDMAFNGGTADVQVLTGADVTNSGTLALGNDTTASGGTLTVDGPGSTWTQTGSSLIHLGAPSGSPATLNVQHGGAFTTGAGEFSVDPAGTVNLIGGTLTVNGALTSTGAFNFASGTLNLLGSNDLSIGTGGLLGTDPVLLSDRTLTVAGTTTIDPARTLTLDGGTLRTGALDNDGALDFRRGTLGVTGAGGFDIGSGALGANVTLGSGAALEVTSTAAIASGASLTLDGGSLTASGTLANSGTLRVNTGMVTALAAANNDGGRVFVSDTFALSGSSWNNNAGSRLTLENGGLLTTSGLFGGLNNSGLVTGDGTIAVKLANSLTGEIRAETGRTLYFTATLHEQNNGKLSLLGGTLDFTAPLTNSSAGFISGRGTLFTGGLTNDGVVAFSGGNADIFGDVTSAAGARIVSSGGAITTFFDDVVHDGAEIRTSNGSASVFFGSVSGSGPFTGTGTVYFEGDLRPGSSPGSVTMTPQAVFSPSNTLTLEIGGRAAGTEHDKLTFTHAATPQVAWSGALVVELINGFTPAAGDAFDVFDFDAARDAGTFTSIIVVDHGLLTAGLTFNFDDLYTTGVIRVVTVGLTFGAWAATVPGDPSATPHGDHNSNGYDNLTEYALGLFPAAPGTLVPNGGLFAYPDGERLRVLFTRPLDRSDVTLRVQGSSDLTTWDDLAVSVNSAAFTGPGFVSENRAHPLSDPGLVEVRDILTSSTARRQIRLLITLAP